MARMNPIEIQKSLKGAEYPARKEDLIHRAEENGADEKVVHFMGELPDKDYRSPADVQKAVGELE